MTATNEKVLLDYQYFIQSAIKKELPWKSLAYFLTDLPTTLDISKQVIRVLVQELEIWVSKVEGEMKDDQEDKIESTLRKKEKLKEKFQRVEESGLTKVITETSLDNFNEKDDHVQGQS